MKRRPVEATVINQVHQSDITAISFKTLPSVEECSFQTNRSKRRSQKGLIFCGVPEKFAFALDIESKTGHYF